MKHYLEEKENVLHECQTDENGLSSGEAANRLEKNGKNKLKEAKKVSLFRRFIGQLADPMIIILLAAAAISAITSAVEGESPADVFIILAVVIINSVLGVYQESKAEKAIEALQQMSAATSKVLRDGKVITVKSEDLAVGDVVLLEAGDAVPADGRLIECASIKAEEAALTGESVPANKTDAALKSENGNVPLGDRKNMVYMGSDIVYGRGKAVVTATGMDTEMGKIADALAQAEEGKTPLQIKLAQLSKILTYLVLGICVFIFGFKLVMHIFEGGGDWAGFALDSFMIAVSLAVAAIPEGLAAVVTVVLSIGVTNMSKKNAIIRKLTAVETLGCAQIICSDKTGTLTQNKMTVVEDVTADKELLCKVMALASDAELAEDGKAKGEPTECALVEFAATNKFYKYNLKKEYPRIGEAPFDSMRKMMSTVHEYDGKIIQFTKGAPDEVLKLCKYILKNGAKIELTEGLKKEVLASNKAMADKALRVLAGAYKEYDAVPKDFEPEHLENELVFVGLCGMIDPVRPEVGAAIAQCRSAGIRPIMITGDHRDTAVAIATQLGIIDSPEQAITGQQLDEISDEEFATEVEKYSVYARVQPEHKVRIVNAWRKNGKITAMTGDGVNDAPSIKSADIGVGMGITGTDVTKNVADMILADDNFSTIVAAVAEGRRIYDNITKTIQFLLSSNLSEVISIFAATVMGFSILKPVHLLWINLITDSIPALALGVEKPEGDIMQRKPRNASDGVFAGGLGFDVVVQGVIVSALTICAYFIGNIIEHQHIFATHDNAMTMAFLTMSMAEIFHSFNMRSRRHSIFTMKSHNKLLWGAMLLSLILTTGVIYIPGVNDAFGFAHINFAEYVIALGLAVVIIPIVEIMKLIQRKIGK